MTDGQEAIVISGRKLRSFKYHRNKKIKAIQKKLSRCVKGSRRWRKLRRQKRKIQEKTRLQLRDLNHKITTEAIRWSVEREIKTLVVGDLKGIANGTKGRLNRTTRQKLGQWEFYTQLQYLCYKAEAVGIEVALASEQHTSSTCPRCGRSHKPKGRNFDCPCGLSLHRDVVGCLNIRIKYLKYLKYLLGKEDIGDILAHNHDHDHDHDHNHDHNHNHNGFRPPKVKYRRIPYLPYHGNQGKSRKGAGVVLCGETPYCGSGANFVQLERKLFSLSEVI